jgi:hypothetical protein
MKELDARLSLLCDEATGMLRPTRELRNEVGHERL